MAITSGYVVRVFQNDYTRLKFLGNNGRVVGWGAMKVFDNLPQAVVTARMLFGDEFCVYSTNTWREVYP